MIRYPIRRPFRLTLAWFIGMLTMGILFSGAVDAVAGSTLRLRPSTATGIAVAKTKAVSVVLPDQTFKSLLTQIKATDAKMDQAVFYLRTHSNQQDVTNYLTLADRCLALAGTYDAEARHYSAALFQHANLPVKIDRGDVTTDCKETPQ